VQVTLGNEGLALLIDLFANNIQPEQFVR